MNLKTMYIISGSVLAFLIILLIMTYVNKNSNDINPQDVVFDFFTDMTEGNFREAMEYYLDEAKESQISTLENNEDLYKVHWANIGIRLDSEEINNREGYAEVGITVSKYNVQEVLNEVKLKLLSVNSLKEDGTYITEEELISLKKQYIKEVYKSAQSKYSPILNTYTINLEKLDNSDERGWVIVNDSSISDILFGNESNVE